MVKSSESSKHEESSRWKETGEIGNVRYAGLNVGTNRADVFPTPQSLTRAQVWAWGFLGRRRDDVLVFVIVANGPEARLNGRSQKTPASNARWGLDRNQALLSDSSVRRQIRVDVDLRILVADAQ